MSLLSEQMESCTIIDKTTSADGYGGVITRWVDGASFNAAIVFDTSMQARVAEKQGVTAMYTVTTERSINLQYHDVFRRESDGSIFRVTSRTQDSTAHPASTVKIAKVTAERWELPA